MGSPRFVSPGAMAGNAIQEFLMQRELQQRAQMEDEFKRKQAEAAAQLQAQEAQRQAQELALRQQQEANDQAERQRVAERQETQDRAAQNQVGVRGMMADAIGVGPMTPERAQQISAMSFREGLPVPGIVEQAMKPTPMPEPFTLSPGSKRFGPDGKEIASVAPTPPQPREPRDERLVQVSGPNGTPIWVRESDAVNRPAAQAPRAVTGAERQSLAYYNRAKDATGTLTEPDASGSTLEERIAKSNLVSQGQLQYAPNLLQTTEQQSYRQAQRAFTEARLRKESGAAIPTAEYENDARTYFAQPGDSPATIAQKRKAREVVLNGMKFSAGKAYDEFYGSPAPEPQTPDTGTKRVYYDINGKPVTR